MPLASPRNSPPTQKSPGKIKRKTAHLNYRNQARRGNGRGATGRDARCIAVPRVQVNTAIPPKFIWRNFAGWKHCTFSALHRRLKISIFHVSTISQTSHSRKGDVGPAPRRFVCGACSQKLEGHGSCGYRTGTTALGTGTDPPELRVEEITVCGCFSWGITAPAG